MATNENHENGENSKTPKSIGFFERLFKSKRDKSDVRSNSRERSRSFWRKSKESRVKMVENKNVEGSIKFADGSNVEMWRRIVDNSIIGTKLIDKAVICTIVGGEIIICNPLNYTPSMEQMKCIINGLEDSQSIQQKGFQVVTDVFNFVDSDESKLIGKLVGGTGGIAVLKTKTAIVIGQWSKRGVDPLNLLTELKTFLDNQGY